MQWEWVCSGGMHLGAWMWDTVVTVSAVGAEFATLYKKNKGWEDDAGIHALSLDAVAERKALQYISLSKCIDLDMLDEAVLKVTNNHEAGRAILSASNKRTLDENADWSYSELAAGYPQVMDLQVYVLTLPVT